MIAAAMCSHSQPKRWTTALLLTLVGLVGCQQSSSGGNFVPWPAADGVVMGDGTTAGDGGTAVDTATTATDAPVGDVATGGGGIIITEIHYNPRGPDGKLQDTKAEWFEVYNPGDAPVDLGGVVIRDDGDDKYNILPGEAVVPAKGYLVIGASADKTQNGGVAVQLAWGTSIQLKNVGGDALVLEKGGVLIDAVRWDNAKGWPFLNGRALNLRPDKRSAAGNDDPKNWCGAQVALTSGDKGTPGQPNSPCDYADADNDGVPDGTDNCKDVQNPAQLDTNKDGVGDNCEVKAPVCGDGKTHPEIGEQCDDGNTDSGDGCSSLCKTEVAVPEGSIIFTEVLPDPKAVSDENGEWFEVYNTTNQAVDLNGVILEAVDKGGWKTTLTATKPISVPAKSYFVLVAKADTSVNGGVTGNHVFGTYPLASKGAKLTLRSAGKVVDEISYSPTTWMMQTGATLSLDPGALDSKSNDDPNNWCLGQATYGLGDLGSPGAQNPKCGGTGMDTDGDGTPDKTDNCPALKNPGQADADGDGVGDTCDNCVATKNADQADANKDGTGDACTKGKCGNKKKELGEQCDDGNTQAGDGCSPTCQLESSLPKPGVGDLVITELMVKAAGGSGDAGEFVEITNVSGKTLDLVGLKLDYKGAVSVTISSFFGVSTLAPGGRYLFGNKDITKNGGLTVQYTLAPVQLGNSGGTVTLYAGGLVVDAVTYGKSAPWPGIYVGKSIQLQPSKTNAKANDAGPAWCLSAQTYAASGWAGTPGKANSCP
ncbi:MAG: lamin tail domain-containing protein [Myxococcales bacterium]|nr:lamin tail domain-containing protein [Myxococcales bacterium]